jgi:hypothetical protein
MSDTQMMVKIGVEASQAISGLNQVTTSTEKLTKSSFGLGAAFGTLFNKVKEGQNAFFSTGKGLDSFLGSAKKAESALVKLPPALDKVKSSSSSANNVLINTGRIFQDLPFGIIGIANNINPLIESFQRASIAAKETGQSVGGTLLKSLTGAGGLGLAFSLITGAATLAVTGLSAFTRGMGGAKTSTDETSESFKKASAEVDKITSNVKGLVNQLQFLNQLGSVNIKILGFGNIEDLRQQAVAQQQLIADIVAARDRLVQKNVSLNDEEGITDKERLDAKDRVRNAIKELNKEEEDASNKNRILLRQIQLQKNEDAKELSDKNKKNYEDYVSSVIERAKELERAFGNVLAFPKLEVDFQTNKEQVFKNAQSVLNDFPKRLLKVKISPSFDIIDPEVKAPEFSKIVTDGIEKATSKLGSLKGLNVSGLFKGFNAASEEMKTLQANAYQTAQIVSGALTPAFTNMFSAIAEGGNVMESFFDGLKQGLVNLINKLISAVIEAALLSVILNATGLGGATNFGSIFGKILGFADGGRPPVGRPSIVGERGPELFIPDTAGRIVSNANSGRIGSAGGLSGGNVSFQISGNNLVGVLARANQSQRRLV